MILQIGYKILHYLYINRKTIYSIAKEMKENPEINFDGHVNLQEIRAIFKTLARSGLKASQEDLEIPVGADFTIEKTIKENKYKHLVEYKQI